MSSVPAETEKFGHPEKPEEDEVSALMRTALAKVEESTNVARKARLAANRLRMACSPSTER